MNKVSVLITPDVIEECLCESIDERIIPASKKSVNSHMQNKKSLK